MKPNMGLKVIVGNWKMYTNAAEAKRLAKAVVDAMGIEDRVSVAVCPPFPYLALVGEILKGSCVALGAQNLYPEKEGALTGEVSPTMLLDLGCKYVIVDGALIGEASLNADQFLAIVRAGISKRKSKVNQHDSNCTTHRMRGVAGPRSPLPKDPRGAPREILRGRRHPRGADGG